MTIVGLQFVVRRHDDYCRGVRMEDALNGRSGRRLAAERPDRRARADEHRAVRMGSAPRFAEGRCHARRLDRELPLGSCCPTVAGGTLPIGTSRLKPTNLTFITIMVSSAAVS